MVITWTKKGIINWMNKSNVLLETSPQKIKQNVNFFIREANKHQNSSQDRKLYRFALPVVEKGVLATKQSIKRFMEL